MYFREDDYDEDEEHHEEGEFDFEQEIHWELAEQSLLRQSIELASAVAQDEVKTAVVAATLLTEHSELSMAIEVLNKAIAKTTSPQVQRALRLKLAEAYLENDDLAAAMGVARMMLGE